MMDSVILAFIPIRRELYVPVCQFNYRYRHPLNIPVVYIQRSYYCSRAFFEIRITTDSPVW
jgi:hypothetical protein